MEDDPNGYSRPTFDVHVPADRDNLTVSAKFLEPDTEYELEVLVLEESGNQTISIIFFKTSKDENSNENNEDDENGDNDGEEDDDGEGGESADLEVSTFMKLRVKMARYWANIYNSS